MFGSVTAQKATYFLKKKKTLCSLIESEIILLSLILGLAAALQFINCLKQTASVSPSLNQFSTDQLPLTNKRFDQQVDETYLFEILSRKKLSIKKDEV